MTGKKSHCKGNSTVFAVSDSPFECKIEFIDGLGQKYAEIENDLNCAFCLVILLVKRFGAIIWDRGGIGSLNVDEDKCVMGVGEAFCGLPQNMKQSCGL